MPRIVACSDLSDLKCAEFLRRDGMNLQYVSAARQNELKLVNIALSSNPEALQFASPKLQFNCIFEIIKKYPSSLQYASSLITDDEELMMALLKRYPHAFEFASSVIKNNYQIVKNLVSRDGYLLRYASKSLKDSEKLALIAIASNILAFDFLSERLQTDDSFLQRAIKKKPYVILRIMNVSKDISLLKIAFALDGSLLQFFHQYQTNRELVSIAIKNKPSAIIYASEKLQNDTKLLLIALKKNLTETLSTAPFLQKNREIVLLAIDISPIAIYYLSPELQKDLEILHAALKKDVNILIDQSLAFICDDEYVMAPLMEMREYDVEPFLSLRLCEIQKTNPNYFKEIACHQSQCKPTKNK